MKYQLLIKLTLAISAVLLFVSCSSKIPVSIPPTESAGIDLNETPMISATQFVPFSTTLIEVQPTTSHWHVLAFGEDDLIRQQYGNFHQHGAYFPNSIFIPAPSVLEYDLNNKYDRFVTTIMLQQDCISSDADGAFFVIELDGEVVYRSQMMFYNSDPVEVSLDLNNVRKIRLETYTSTNIGASDPSMSCDSTIWGDPILYTDKPRIDENPSLSLLAPDLSLVKGTGNVMAEFFISPDGNDLNLGTKDQPFATIQHARDEIRLLNREMTGQIIVNLREGTFRIQDTIEFTEIDSGSNGYEIIYRAYNEEKPIISGGVEVFGFVPVEGQHYWKLDVPEGVKPFRNLYINGKRALRAQTELPVLGVDFWKGEWSDRDGIVMAPNEPGWWIPMTDQWGRLGLVMEPADLPSFSRPQDLELHTNLQWIDIRSRVEDIVQLENGRYAFKMYQPYFSWQQNLKYVGWENWPEPGGDFYNPTWNRPFLIENALELINQPGEWYYNKDTRELYYYPREGDEINSIETVISQTEQLMTLNGAGIGKEIHSLVFEGITFAHNSWMRASLYGIGNNSVAEIVDGEGALFCCGPSYFSISPLSSILLDDARNIRFTQNVFQHIGSAGLGMDNNVFDIEIIGNVFYDLSDAGIKMGSLYDQAYIDKPGEGLVRDILINNNLVYQSGVEYWGAYAIIGHFVQKVEISHNYIYEAPNSGIGIFGGGISEYDSVTTGQNLILNNRVEMVSMMGDTSDYTLGGSDAGAIYLTGNKIPSVVKGNYVKDVIHNYTCFYLDLAGNINLSIENNVCDNAPIWIAIWYGEESNAPPSVDGDNLITNTYTNSPKALSTTNWQVLSETKEYHSDVLDIHIYNTHNIEGSDWPQEALSIIENAGLEEDYQYLLGLLN